MLQLVDRLDAPESPAQDAAQASLIKLGPKILPLLPDAATAKTAGTKEPYREDPHRPAQGHAARLTTAATKVTIKGKGIRLSEALQQLQKQTGNAITDLREQLGVEVTNPALDLEINDKSFFEALDQIARQAEVTLTYATGDGTIGIMGGLDGRGPRQAGEQAQADGAVHRPVPGRAQAVGDQPRLYDRCRDRQRAARSRLGAAAAADALEAQFRKPQDHRRPQQGGRAPGQAARPTKSWSGPRTPRRDQSEPPAPEREAKKLTSLKVKAEITIPAGIKTFKFPSLAEKNVDHQAG